MAEIRRRRPRAADLEESEMPSEFTLEKFSQNPFYQEVNRRLVALARLRPGLRVVDLGAGTGAVTRLLEEVRSRGFAFQIELNYICWREGYSIAEVPVNFVNRQRGRSKMSLAIGLETAALLWRLALGTPSLR